MSTHEATTEPTPCPSCGAPLAGAYCHRCGERRRDPADLTLRAFARASFSAIVDLDSRLWRTFRALVASPGRLTREWAEGRRRPWLAPIRVFLIANVIYFVAQSITDFNTFTTPLEIHLSATAHSEVARDFVRGRMADREEDYNLFRARFDDASRTQAKSLVILMVPMLAAVIALLQWRGRRPVAIHLVFALHALAFVMLLGSALDPLMLGLASVVRVVANDALISVAYILAIWAWLGFGFRGAYGNRPWVALALGALAVLAFAAILSVYRFLLFFTVFYTV